MIDTDQGEQMAKREEQARLDGLRALEAFAECSDDELERIDSLVTETRIPAGRVIMTEGKPGLEFVVLQEGTATITREGNELGTVGPGAIVGEMALLDPELGPRSATVTAASDIRALVLNAGEFTSLLRESPTMREKILRTKAMRTHPAGKKS